MNLSIGLLYSLFLVFTCRGGRGHLCGPNQKVWFSLESDALHQHKPGIWSRFVVGLVWCDFVFAVRLPGHNITGHWTLSWKKQTPNDLRTNSITKPSWACAATHNVLKPSSSPPPHYHHTCRENHRFVPVGILDRSPTAPFPPLGLNLRSPPPFKMQRFNNYNNLWCTAIEIQSILSVTIFNFDFYFQKLDKIALNFIF